MIMNDNECSRDQFLKEFKELLDRYDVSIEFSVGEGSDTYGIYDERMTIVDKRNNEWLSISGWGIIGDDIRI